MIKNFRTIIALGLCFSAAPALLYGKKAHTHGAGTLSFAVEGKKVDIELELPAHDVFGFESKHKAKKQKKKVEQLVAKLMKPESFFKFDVGLKCTLSTHSLKAFGEDHYKNKAKHDHDHKEGKKHKHEHESSNHHDSLDHKEEHSELLARYQATCMKSPEGKSLKVSLGKIFPGVKKLQVQILGSKSQKAIVGKGKEFEVKL